MLRALPILVILGLAIYSFFDVVNSSNTPNSAKPVIRRGRRGAWLVVVLIPVIGAGLWFLLGRPSRKRDPNQPPRVINIKGGSGRQVAPDDDPRFIRKLDDDAWQRKRKESRSKPAAQPEPKSGPQKPENPKTESETPEPQAEAKEQPSGEKDAGTSS